MQLPRPTTQENLLQGVTQMADALVKEPGWVTIGATGAPAFANSYAAFGSGHRTPAFCIDALGWVHLRGLVTRGGGLTPVFGEGIFTLPLGYRPLEIEMFLCAAGEAGAAGVNDGNAARVDVNANGNVAHIRSIKAYVETDYISLAGIHFRAA